MNRFSLPTCFTKIVIVPLLSHCVAWIFLKVFLHLSTRIHTFLNLVFWWNCWTCLMIDVPLASPSDFVQICKSNLQSHLTPKLTESLFWSQKCLTQRNLSADGWKHNLMFGLILIGLFWHKKIKKKRRASWRKFSCVPYFFSHSREHKLILGTLL